MYHVIAGLNIESSFFLALCTYHMIIFNDRSIAMGERKINDRRSNIKQFIFDLIYLISSYGLVMFITWLLK